MTTDGLPSAPVLLEAPAPEVSASAEREPLASIDKITASLFFFLSFLFHAPLTGYEIVVSEAPSAAAVVRAAAAHAGESEWRPEPGHFRFSRLPPAKGGARPAPFAFTRNGARSPHGHPARREGGCKTPQRGTRSASDSAPFRACTRQRALPE